MDRNPDEYLISKREQNYILLSNYIYILPTNAYH